MLIAPHRFRAPALSASRHLAVLGTALALAATPVVSVGTTPASSIELSTVDRVAAVAPHAVGSSLYAFTTVLSGQPVRWNPCTPIHWKFRAAGAPAGGWPVVAAAVARIGQATGTRWVFDGVVGGAPTRAWLPTSVRTVRPVLIGWTDAAHSDLLRGQPRGVYAVTRTAWFSSFHLGVPGGTIRTAVIALDATDRLPANGPGSWKTVVLHELGHVMGLAHAGSSRQQMYPVLQRSLTDLQAGDLQGLSRVGRRAGCL
jgi:hypothetical protein